MKQIFLKATTALLTLSALYSCGEDATMDESLNLNNGKTLESISITGNDFLTEAGTRSSVVISNAGVNFLWEEGDVVGIFPNTGDQVSFAMDEGAGMQTATFNGGGWALKASSTYAAYYPHDFYNRDLTAIPVSYESQAQTGNASTAHLGAYDFMAASVTTPSNGAVAFDMQHMGALVMIQTDLDEAKTLTNVALKASTSAFTTTGTIDLTAVNPEITAKSTTSTLNIALNDFIVAANETSTIYFLMAPTNLSGETLEITLSDESGAYIKFEAAGKNFVAGTAYAYTLTNGEKLNTLPEYAVDLGLPSGTLWADRNVGADAPEAYGDYFAWGETEPKSTYNWSTYKWCNGSDEVMTKYCTDSSFGAIDGNTILDLEDDAAYVNMGEEWRMPTLEEQEELCSECTWLWTTQNGVNGYKVTGDNGNSIFLPAAGYRYNSNLNYVGSTCDYWAGSLFEDYPIGAIEIEFSSNSYMCTSANRCAGHSVRAVVR
ncbi:MAG: fimbrillin family protein [Bacteroidaceae bacterium]|nr:fimbrillin family protein [Bacteroidaceae bacterium]